MSNKTFQCFLSYRFSHSSNRNINSVTCRDGHVWLSLCILHGLQHEWICRLREWKEEREGGEEEGEEEAEVSEHNSTSPVCSTVVYRVVPPNSTAQHGNAAVALSDSPTLFVDAIVVKTRDSARGKDSVSAF